MADPIMNRLQSKEIYKYTCLDHVENVEQYRVGGLHPVNLGDIIVGRYKVIHKLGHGGFSTIWLARDLDKHCYVALKILIGDCPTDEYMFLSHLRDAGANHPNIISLLSQFTIHGPNGLHQCFVLEFVGPSLSSMTLYGPPLTGRMVRNAVRQIAEGLAHLHALGIGHGGRSPLVSTEALH